jgi:hypothetical protein
MKNSWNTPSVRITVLFRTIGEDEHLFLECLATIFKFAQDSYYYRNLALKF